MTRWVQGLWKRGGGKRHTLSVVRRGNEPYSHSWLKCPIRQGVVTTLGNLVCLERMGMRVGDEKPLIHVFLLQSFTKSHSNGNFPSLPIQTSSTVFVHLSSLWFHFLLRHHPTPSSPFRFVTADFQPFNPDYGFKVPVDTEQLQLAVCERVHMAARCQFWL